MRSRGTHTFARQSHHEAGAAHCQKEPEMQKDIRLDYQYELYFQSTVKTSYKTKHKK